MLEERGVGIEDKRLVTTVENGGAEDLDLLWDALGEEVNRGTGKGSGVGNFSLC